MRIFFLSLIIILSFGGIFSFGFNVNEIKQKIIPTKKVIKVLKIFSKEKIIISSTKNDNYLPGYYLYSFSDSFINSIIRIDEVFDYYSTGILISGKLPEKNSTLFFNKLKIDLNNLPPEFQKYFFDNLSKDSEFIKIVNDATTNLSNWVSILFYQ